ncbi:hypothetical protein PIB30_007421 [Stylosanthes scabra]|uniref:Uncharacterized protein n=1 Tax=Stylosanthes scabra TaxID=79078 RepID=A0ABU6Q4T4_9FABA|nr:hypothetical protein [Stylosanthes scabra]
MVAESCNNNDCNHHTVKIVRQKTKEAELEQKQSHRRWFAAVGETVVKTRQTVAEQGLTGDGSSLNGGDRNEPLSLFADSLFSQRWQGRGGSVNGGGDKLEGNGGGGFENGGLATNNVGDEGTSMGSLSSTSIAATMDSFGGDSELGGGGGSTSLRAFSLFSSLFLSFSRSLTLSPSNGAGDGGGGEVREMGCGATADGWCVSEIRVNLGGSNWAIVILLRKLDQGAPPSNEFVKESMHALTPLCTPH